MILNRTLILCVSALAIGALGGCADMYEARQAKRDGDYTTAFDHYSRLAEFGLPDAKLELARMYIRGEGVPENPALGVPLLREAAEAGEPKAYYELARLYEKGDGGLPQSGAKADEYYQKAMDMGYVNAAYYRARMYEKGKLVPQDITRAMSLYQKAAAENQYGRAAGALGKLTEEYGFIPETEKVYGNTQAETNDQAVMALALYYAAVKGGIDDYAQDVSRLEGTLPADQKNRAYSLSNFYL